MVISQLAIFSALASGFSLRGLDLGVILVYLAAMIGVGLWVGRGQKSTLEYFLGDRNLPWWAVLLSIVATETSTVTFLSIPGMAFAAGGDFRFLQITLGYIVGRILVAIILLPLYFRGEPFTAYEVLERRFGPLTRRTTAVLFLAMRCLADGLRLYLSALVLREAMGLSLAESIVAMGVVTIAYTVMGGVKSVIWNDCLQFVIYILGAVVALRQIVVALPEGWSSFLAFAQAEHKLRWLDFDLSLVKPTMTFWSGLIGGVFLAGASHGADQLTVQRLLTARSQRSAAAALVLSGVVVMLQFALFLTIGVALAAFYQVHPPALPFSPQENDRVFAHFIVHSLPSGLVGLTLAAVFAAAMSTVAGSLNSLATVLVKDLIAPLSRTAWSEASLLRLSKAATVLFGFVQIAIALLSEQWGVQGSVINQVLKIAAFASGPLLGLYLLGVLTNVRQTAALVGFVVGVGVLAGVALRTELAWPWYSVLGAGCTVLAAKCVSWISGAPPKLSVAAQSVAMFAAFACCGAATAQIPPVDPATIGLDARRFASIDREIAQEIAAGQLPGCVVAIGRTGGIGFLKAYGERQVEPSREPMTVDTLFDMASITKPVACATSVMLLVERGQMRLREPMVTYIPEFGQHGKELITVEQLLTHQAGLVPDNPESDFFDGEAKAWQRIFALTPQTPPGTRFVYSDVGFMVLGEAVHRVTGQSVAEFARENIYKPLKMNDTGYLPVEALKTRAATTEKRDGQWLKGVVHDPRSARLGGVAGHAGLFSTAGDLAIYCDAMLRALRSGGGEAAFMTPLTAAEMVRPRNIAGDRRGLGWDVLTSYSKNRGDLLSRRAFGHGGFTGTALWIDPELDLFVIFLSTRLHPDGVGEVNRLAGRIGAIAASAIDPKTLGPFDTLLNRLDGDDGAAGVSVLATASGAIVPTGVARTRPPSSSERPNTDLGKANAPVLNGVDVLARDSFHRFAGKRVGLITNHTGRLRDGTRTIDALTRASGVKLEAIFSPEHGVEGRLDQNDIGDSRDAATSVPIYSLYGATRAPTAKQLENLDVLVFDIQDVGARFYTYVATMKLAMEAAAKHNMAFVVLDRPNPIGGVDCGGPMLDAGREDFVAPHNLPVRHGLTVGEIAQLLRAERKWDDLQLAVIPADGWRRGMLWDELGQMWINPSPNLRSFYEALLYPGLGLLETTNVSVGRGTDAPFEVLGAPWIDADKLSAALAAELSASPDVGVRWEPIRFTPSASKFEREPCQGLRFTVTDPHRCDSVRLGLALAVALHRVHGQQWQAAAMDRLLRSQAVLDQILAGKSAGEIEASLRGGVEEFQRRRKPFLLYEE